MVKKKVSTLGSGLADGSVKPRQLAAPTSPSAGAFAVDLDPNFFQWAGTPTSGGAGTPSSTVVSETSFGQSPNAGSGLEYSRGDHTHGSSPHDDHANLTNVLANQHHPSGNIKELTLGLLNGITKVAPITITEGAGYARIGLSGIDPAHLSYVGSAPTLNQIPRFNNPDAFEWITPYSPTKLQSKLITDISTNSTSWVDTGLALTFTLAASTDVLISVAACVTLTSSTTYAYQAAFGLKLVIDGNSLGTGEGLGRAGDFGHIDEDTSALVDSGAIVLNISSMLLKTLAAGSHTVKIYWIKYEPSGDDTWFVYCRPSSYPTLEHMRLIVQY